jgi:hypothetical protein
VDLLGVKLTHATGFYQLDSVMEGCRPVKYVPKGFIEQRAGRRVIPTLTSMYFYEQLTAILSGNTSH